MSNPHFTRLLAHLQWLHDLKNHDYAEDGNPFSNFEHAATMAGVSVEQVFDVLIGVKDARLIQLMERGKKPNNESVVDTVIDKLNYECIKVSYWMKQNGIEDLAKSAA